MALHHPSVHPSIHLSSSLERYDKRKVCSVIARTRCLASSVPSFLPPPITGTNHYVPSTTFSWGKAVHYTQRETGRPLPAQRLERPARRPQPQRQRPTVALRFKCNLPEQACNCASSSWPFGVLALFFRTSSAGLLSRVISDPLGVVNLKSWYCHQASLGRSLSRLGSLCPTMALIRRVNHSQAVAGFPDGDGSRAGSMELQSNLLATEHNMQSSTPSLDGYTGRWLIAG